MKCMKNSGNNMPNFDTPEFTTRVHHLAHKLYFTSGYCSGRIEDEVAAKLNSDKMIHDVTIESIVHEIVMSAEAEAYRALLC